uniref:Calmodulin like 4 n=1 Tax=Leptobrachium leishanense TaxID=445787 RepID=A0A8C5PE53_9ANUR
MSVLALKRSYTLLTFSVILAILHNTYRITGLLPVFVQAKFLSQDEINKYKECFSLYDKKGKGKIPAADLLTVMRCLGTCPTQTEVTRHLQILKMGKDGEVDFSSFLTIMYRQQKQEDPENEILVAMLMSDKQKKGLIPVSELRAKLTQMGEKLTPEEVDGLLKNADIGPDGMLRYEEFVRRITLPVPDY